jgi:hypothetical protein
LTAVLAIPIKRHAPGGGDLSEASLAAVAEKLPSSSGHDSTPSWWSWRSVVTSMR